MTHTTASAVARQAVEAWAHVRSIVTPWELSYAQTLVWAVTCEVEETWVGADDRSTQARFEGFDLASMFRSAWWYGAFDTLHVKVDALQARGEPLGDLLAHALQVWPTLDDDDPVLIEQVTNAAKWLASITPREDLAGQTLSLGLNGTTYTVVFGNRSGKTLASVAAYISEILKGVATAAVNIDGTLQLQIQEGTGSQAAELVYAHERMRRLVQDLTLPDAPPPARRRHDDPPAHIGRRLGRRLRKGARR